MSKMCDVHRKASRPCASSVLRRVAKRFSRACRKRLRCLALLVMFAVFAIYVVKLPGGHTEVVCTMDGGGRLAVFAVFAIYGHGQKHGQSMAHTTSSPHIDVATKKLAEEITFQHFDAAGIPITLFSLGAVSWAPVANFREDEELRKGMERMEVRA